MHKYFTVLIISLLFCLQHAVSFSAQTIQIQQVDNPLLKSFPIKAKLARAPLTTVNLTAPHALRVVDQHTNPNSGIKHQRLQQFFQGIPVHGKQVLLHEKNGTTTKVRGQLATNIEADLFRADATTTAPLSPQQVIDYFQSLFVFAHIGDDAVQETIFIDTKGIAHHAYEVEFFVPGQHPMRPAFIIDSKTNELLDYQNKIAHAKAIKAYGYGGHSDHQYVYGRNPRYPALEFTYSAPKCYMDNSNVMTIDLHHKTTNSSVYVLHPPEPISYYCSPRNNYMRYDREDVNGGIAVENDAHYYGTVVYNMYRDWYGLSPVNGKLIMRVHYDTNFANAFWDGMTMTFGDGDDTLYPMMSLEITGHEVSHGFTQHHSNLEYRYESGSVNESFSDMAGKAAEYYAYGSVHWSIGEGVVRDGQGVICEAGGQDAFRCMNDPHKSAHGLGISHISEFAVLNETAERLIDKRIVSDELVEKLIEEIAEQSVDYFFRDSDISDERREQLIQEYRDFLTLSFSGLIKKMLIEELKQGIIVHNGSGIYNRVFYLLSTSPGWNVRKAFDVMVNANMNYWQADDDFVAIGTGVVQSAKELKYNVQDVIHALADVGISCTDHECHAE